MSQSHDPTPYVVMAVIAFVVFAILAAAINRARELRYSNTVAAWAAGRGWTFREGGGGQWGAHLPRGVRNGVRLQVEGSIASAARTYPLIVAHYWWQTQHQAAVQRSRQVLVGNSYQTRWETHWETKTVTHDRTVYILCLPRPVAPVAVQPRGLGSRAAHALGLSRGRPSGNDKFDRSFRVYVTSEATGVPELPVALLRAHCDGDVPPWSARGCDLIAMQQHRLRPEAVDAFARRLARVADALTP